jgi:cell division protein ZapA (FtsZ GTPase activity inhibitor)
LESPKIATDRVPNISFKTSQDPAQLQMLADFVEKKIKEISDATTVQSTLDLAMLTLLNMAKDLYDSEVSREKLEKDVEEVTTRSIEKIQNEIPFNDSV